MRPAGPVAVVFPSLAAISTALLLAAAPLGAQTEGRICTGFGPQSPRDITRQDGTNSVIFAPAPPASRMNLCNIHTHTQAEHKGPGYSIFAGTGQDGGWSCNETFSLTNDELTMPPPDTPPATPDEEPHGAFGGVMPGDTIEVHWVYTSCDVAPGEGLGACSSATCTNPQLRVESQVFLVVNDPKALNFADFDLDRRRRGGFYQPKALPTDTGDPVVYAGSTTGPDYDEQKCSPYQVTWSVRPLCAKLDINSLFMWAKEGNVFHEAHSHGVRQILTPGALLSPIP